VVLLTPLQTKIQFWDRNVGGGNCRPWLGSHFQDTFLWYKWGTQALADPLSHGTLVRDSLNVRKQCQGTLKWASWPQEGFNTGNHIARGIHLRKLSLAIVDLQSMERTLEGMSQASVQINQARSGDLPEGGCMERTSERAEREQRQVQTRRGEGEHEWEAGEYLT
jgi:hypothetical protein